ncbi:MAG: hydroxyacid dehydrogenase [Candidatus Margulisbacteria bacterium]|nr:hydroxyacid dehydrogenase [Candidatus Margulisiibacteriota bacterium]
MSKEKILISDKLSEEGLLILNKKYQVDVLTGLSEEELVSIVADYDAMIVRSETNVTKKIINATKKMKIIGRAGVGVDNIDVQAAHNKGIVVVNSPEGNTVAAAEYTLGMVLSVSRNIPFSHQSLQDGKWDRPAFLGTELRGKTLGIIGLGKIGRQVALYAKAFGMKVVGYDVGVTNAYPELDGLKLLDLNEVLSTSDFLTLHIPKNKDTEGLFNKSMFDKMKDGVFFVNCSRGGIVVEKDLKDAVESGKVKAAAVDVFSEEPAGKRNSLIGVKNIITTPHLGAATKEAKINVAIDVAKQVDAVLSGDKAGCSVCL